MHVFPLFSLLSLLTGQSCWILEAEISLTSNLFPQGKRVVEEWYHFIL
ncbi:MAG: hypothetical protein KKE53_05625 [Proteobacteria bacterium]|nr:hypothetical protein [Pseudomonadota bacterium]